MRVRGIPTLTFVDGPTGISTHTAFMTGRFFVAGFVETDRLPSSLSADLFRRNPIALMALPGGFLWKLESSSSWPLVAGVPNVEPALLLGKGIEEEALVDVVVEASTRSAAAFALYLAMVPTIRARLMLSGQEMDSGLFAGR
jgi:hypothetical protein